MGLAGIGYSDVPTLIYSPLSSLPSPQLLLTTSQSIAIDKVSRCSQASLERVNTEQNAPFFNDTSCSSQPTHPSVSQTLPYHHSPSVWSSTHARQACRSFERAPSMMPIALSPPSESCIHQALDLLLAGIAEANGVSKLAM